MRSRDHTCRLTKVVESITALQMYLIVDKTEFVKGVYVISGDAYVYDI